MEQESEIGKPLDFKKETISFSTPLQKKPSKKKPLFVFIILIIIVLILGFVFRDKIKGLFGGTPQPTPSPIAVQTPLPSPSPIPLIRSEWSIEVLNGSGISGLAKDIAVKLQALGYAVVKTGNANTSNYSQTEIWVKEELSDKVELVIADIKDVVKIASQGGELKDSTASARIILGKDLK